MKQLAIVVALFAAGAAIPIIGFRSVDAADPGRRDAGAPGQATDPYDTAFDRLPDSPAGDVVRRSIENAGGWSVWIDTPSVAYRKITTPLGPEGEPAGEPAVEHHRYALNPALRIRIDNADADGRAHVRIHDGQQAWYLVDGALQTDQERVNSAYNSTAGSHYVFGMPFKLADPGVTLAHLGQVELPDGTTAEAVRVGYAESAGSAGGQHRWTYYFDPADARLRAYHIVYGAGAGDATWGEYHDHRTVGGWTMPTRRVSYASDAEGTRGEPRSEIVYEDIELGVELPDELFRREPAGS